MLRAILLAPLPAGGAAAAASLSLLARRRRHILTTRALHHLFLQLSGISWSRCILHLSSSTAAAAGIEG